MSIQLGAKAPGAGTFGMTSQYMSTTCMTRMSDERADAEEVRGCA